MMNQSSQKKGNTEEEDELQQGQCQEVSDQQGQSSQFITTSKAGRKNICDTCVKSLSKYTCPGCNVKSCSIACINKHKIDRQCSGKPQFNAYVQKNEIKQDVVKKDYLYVKSVLEDTDKVKKNLTGVTSHQQEPKRFYLLRKHARTQYNIKVHQAPPMIQRHRQNISFFFMKTKTIYWVIQIAYFAGNKRYIRQLLQPQPDTKTIQQIIKTDFLSQQLLLKQINTQKTEQFDIFIENRDVTPMQNKNEREDREGQDVGKTKQQTKYLIQLHRDKALFECLKNLNIYQFPTLIVVHKSLRKLFCKWKKIHF